VVRTTWAPADRLRSGTTIAGGGATLSLAGLICYHPDGRRARLLVGHVVGAYHPNALIALLQRPPTLLDQR
jgi:hypothetical protein